MPTILKNHYALYMEPFTTPSTDGFLTFYEGINIVFEKMPLILSLQPSYMDPSVMSYDFDGVLIGMIQLHV